MTHREIVSALVACTVIGAAIVAIMFHQILQCPEWNTWMLVWPGAGILFVLGCVVTSYVQVFWELRRRRNS